MDDGELCDGREAVEVIGVEDSAMAEVEKDAPDNWKDSEEFVCTVEDETLDE